MSLILIPVQILLLLFLVFAFSRVYLRFRERTIHLGAFIFWSVVWSMAILGVLFPSLTTWVAGKMGIGRGVDAVIYASLALLFYLVYRTNVLLENLKQELTELVRKLALDEGKDKPKKKQQK